MLSIHEPNIAAPLLVEFDVSINFMGMAIGSQGANITSARSLDGIKDIILDESTRNQGFCKFKVFSF
uniref:K Homology domain-containing protein n=1 Tax=Meloidogyne javanica TaxID=6303 RepID=A0A915MSK0_MELJA